MKTFNTLKGEVGRKKREAVTSWMAINLAKISLSVTQLLGRKVAHKHEAGSEGIRVVSRLREYWKGEKDVLRQY